MEMELANKKNQFLKNNGMRAFGTRDKLGYMFGDVGNCMFFGFIGGYLMLFYTDIAGLSAAAVGTLLLVARIWDAINDPIIGTIIDSKKPDKSGKFRRYLWYFAIPVVVAGILCFTTIPNASQGVKLAYAYVTYILFGMMYTCINIPYGSLSSVMTNDPVERTSLSTFRSIGGMVANFIIMAIAPLIIFSNEVATTKGFFIAALIFGVVAIASYRASYNMVTERVIHKQQNKEKIDLKKTLMGIFKNRGLLGIMIASLAQLTSMMLAQTLTPYLFKDYFNAPHLIGLAGIMTMVVSFVILPMLGPLVKKFGKKEIVSYGMIVSTVMYALAYILPIKNPLVFIGIQMLASFGMGFMNVLIWAMVSDSIDYHEYLTGERKEGIVYASYSLVRKLGQAAAGGLAGVALTYVGYVSGAASQTAEAALGIKQMATLAPAIAGVISIVALIFVCNLSKERLVKLNEDLDKIRAE